MLLEEDIVASSKISVVDPEGTQALKRQAEAARVPVVVRYYTNAADDLERRASANHLSRRAKIFSSAVNKSFGHRKLSTGGTGLLQV